MTMDYSKINHWIIELITQVLASIISKAIDNFLEGIKKRKKYLCKLYIIKSKGRKVLFFYVQNHSFLLVLPHSNIPDNTLSPDRRSSFSCSLGIGKGLVASSIS